MVGDLTGFLASIFMRGMPFVQVPTTLLAMVDAGHRRQDRHQSPRREKPPGHLSPAPAGGHRPGISAHPAPPERLNGLAEVIKAGFIRDRGLVEHLEQEGLGLFKKAGELLEIIYRAAAIKAASGGPDEREQGQRRILNFGHTLGHGLEAASGFKLPHGRAVAWGMLMALHLSERLAHLPQEESRRGQDLLKRFGYARHLPRLDREASTDGPHPGQKAPGIRPGLRALKAPGGGGG